MYSTIEALFIDMDGTLIDTDAANTAAYHYALKLVTGDSIVLDAGISRITSQTVRQFFPNMKSSLFQKVKSIKDKQYNRLLSLTKVNQNIVSFIEDNREKSIVLVSKANHKRVVSTLIHHNILDYFDYFFCNESKVLGKTYNKYIDAIHGLCIFPQNVLVFENEDLEIANALIANIPFKNIKKIGK